MRGFRCVVAMGVFACLGVAASDMTILSASTIHTMDPALPRVQSIAFDAQGLIVAVGARDALAERYPDARRIDAGEATVVPGLIDAHGHVAGLGLSQLRADLQGTRSKQEVLTRLQAFSSKLPQDAWLLGRGWDQNDWPDQRFPDAADLDAAFPERPVWLGRIDGHAGWANSAALRAVTRDLRGDWQPDGGRIERDANGRPSGVFVDAAMELVEAAVPPLGPEGIEQALTLGMRSAVEHGLTGVHDAGVSLAEMQAYQRLAARGALPLRISAMADGDGAALAWICREGLYRHPSGRLQMRAVKLYADGALGSRGAAMLADYSDDAGNRGLLLTKRTALAKIIGKAKGCEVQVATHAIGDHGNREVLDAYAEAWRGEKDPGHRWRIEHAQVLSAEDLPRLALLGVIASVQPTHATSDMPWAEDRVGPDRIQGSYAWRKLRDSGARLALGSDFPVESVDPRLGLYSATTRSDGEGQPFGGWRPQEKLTAFEALRGFTLDAAFAGFAESAVGSLEVGKRADFVILEQDPLAIEPRALRALDVRATYVDGKPVFEATKR